MYVYCNDLFVFSLRYNGHSSPEALFGRADILSAPDSAGPAQGGGCAAGSRCTSVSAKGVRRYLQQVKCSPGGLGA